MIVSWEKSPSEHHRGVRVREAVRGRGTVVGYVAAPESVGYYALAIVCSGDELTAVALGALRVEQTDASHDFGAVRGADT